MVVAEVVYRGVRNLSYACRGSGLAQPACRWVVTALTETTRRPALRICTAKPRDSNPDRNPAARL
jgi:hypothetical protein